jgi:hypothetical protein
MRQALGPYVTTGIAIVGASLIAVTPVAPPTPNPQQRALNLVDYTEYDASQLASATEANWSGLESILSSSNWTTDPDISQGLSTLFSDISAGTSNAVTNPLSELTEGALALFSSDYGFNAAFTALTAVTDNVESALSGGDYSLALTDLENGFTTVEYAFLNGYPDSVGSGLISPEFGLLTNTTDGAATGQIDALAQISNTIADEVANLGGANLTTGSLPLVTGNLDLSINLDQILSDLGLTSGGGALTINGLLGDLGISPTSDILPNLTIGDVLGDLGLSDGSGLTPDQILADLGIGSITGGVYSDPALTPDQILADLGIGSITGGVYSDPALTPDQILADLGIGSITGGVYSDPNLSIDQILAELGVITYNSATNTYSDPSIFSVDQVLADLGVISYNSATNTYSDPSISLSTLEGDLGIPTGGISIDTLLADLGINTTGSIGVSLPTVTLGSVFSALGINTTGNIKIDGISISVSSLYSDLGINLNASYTPSAGISISTLLNDLGIGSQTLSVNSLLSDLGFNTSGTYSLDTLLGDLGLGTSNSLTVDQILSALGLSGSSGLDINSILGDLGLSGTGGLDINSILGDLGLSGTQGLDINSILGDLGLSGTQGLDINSILGDLGLSDSSTIPLPSFSIDGILGDLGINPDENILTLLGISDPLSLNPSIDLDGGAVATYADDLAKDLLAVLGSIEPASADLPSLLTTEPAVDLTNLLSGLLTGLDVPVSVSGNLSLDLTSVVAELVPSLF